MHERHGHAACRSPTYRTWTTMKSRCSNPKDSFFSYYGGRGITVCQRWQEFLAFLADMGERPIGTTLDRIDNDGPYSKANCQWSTAMEQARHRSSTCNFRFRGEDLCVADWADRFHIKRQTLYTRLRRGWSIEKSLTTKIRDWGR